MSNKLIDLSLTTNKKHFSYGILMTITNKSEGNRRLRMTLGWTDVSIVISKIVNDR